MPPIATSSLAERATRFARLRPRDTDLVRALIEQPASGEKEVAASIGMSLHTAKGRLKHVFLVLDVVSRLHLYAEYHALLSPCDCLPRSGEPEAAKEIE